MKYINNPQNKFHGPILTLNSACLFCLLLLWKRGLKAPRMTRRAMVAQRTQPSAGARWRGVERPELLVL